MNGVISRAFPYFSHGSVVKGYGRGSKKLGIPTVLLLGRGLSGGPPRPPTFPVFLRGAIAQGFRRGRAQLNFPTANFPDSVVENLPADFNCGIYYGWANVDSGPVYKMVMSVGWNPFFQNKKKTMETHILHTFKEDFYGSILKVCIVDYLRPEKTFSSLDDLIAAIKEDIRQANEELDKAENIAYKEDGFFKPVDVIS